MHAKILSNKKEAARLQGQDEKFAGPFTRMSCARAYCPAPPGEASERERVGLPLPPLNSFNQVATTQLFKLVSLHLE